MRLLAIHAHPDDESSKGAATTAMYAAQGHEVLVLTCTGGERGEILNPAMDRPGVAENIQTIRREEMAAAAEALGVQHRWLGYVDSGMENPPEGSFARANSAEVVAKIVAIIREFRPEVIITYDENGGYPHPDHLKVHEVSMAAWDLAGDPEYGEGEPWTPLKLYYTHGFIRQRMVLFDRYFQQQNLPSPFTDILDRWEEHKADIMARVTTQVYCQDFFAHRDRALRAHATQIDPAGAFAATPVSVQQELWPTEEFELARTRVSTTMPEDDLLAGLE